LFDTFLQRCIIDNIVTTPEKKSRVRLQHYTVTLKEASPAAAYEQPVIPPAVQFTSTTSFNRAATVDTLDHVLANGFMHECILDLRHS
jgi:hypothetical protein